MISVRHEQDEPCFPGPMPWVNVPLYNRRAVQYVPYVPTSGSSWNHAKAPPLSLWRYFITSQLFAISFRNELPVFNTTQAGYLFDFYVERKREIGDAHTVGHFPTLGVWYIPQT